MRNILIGFFTMLFCLSCTKVTPDDSASDPNSLWGGTKQFGISSSMVFPGGVATDGSNNVFIAGGAVGGLDGNTPIGTRDAFIKKYSPTGIAIWTSQMGASSGTVHANGVATDSLGNSYIAGGISVSGSNDSFVAKYDSDGSKLWVRQLSVASSTTTANAVATDSSNNIYVAGYTSGGLDGNTLTGGFDFFVAKYDSDGVKIWTRQLGVAGSNTRGFAVRVDSSSNVYVAGDTDGNLDGNALQGLGDVFVTKYDSSGSKLWTKQIGAPGAGTNQPGLAIDQLNNIYLSGATGGSIDGTPLTGNADFFLVKFDLSGVKQWTKQFGVAGKNVQGNFSLAVDSNNNIYAAGLTDTILAGSTLFGTQDGFAVKYNSSGVQQWVKQLGAPSSAAFYTFGLAVDGVGNVFVTGGTDAGMDGNSMTGLQDCFVASFSSAGLKR